MSVLRTTLLSAAAIALTVSTAMAGEKRPVGDSKTVVAKLLILPGDNSPTGYTDLDSPARNVSLGGEFTEGSSSYNGQNDQNNRPDILDDTELGKAALGITVTKAHNPVRTKRKVRKTKKKRVKVVRYSIPRIVIKRRAALMLGVYR